MKANIKSLCYSAMFAALIAVCAQLTVPMPSGVGFTLQTFAVALCGLLLGPRWGLVSVLVYLLTGGVGAPVFSGFNGGAHVLLGPTGGFLLGFLPMAALCGLGARAKRRLAGALWGLPGLLLCHLAGVVWFMLLRELDFVSSALLVSIPYLLKDILSLAAAALLSWRLAPLLARHGIPAPAERRGKKERSCL